jgi:signal transduction histidine kinase
MLDNYYLPILIDAQDKNNGTHKFTNITGLSIDSTLSIIAELPEKSIVVVCSYSEDKNGLAFTTPEAANLISRVSKVPVFILGNDSFPNDGGVIGGLVINYINAGKEFGKAANQILKGEDPKLIKADLPSLYQYIFDWRELKRWGLLDSKAIPPESTFLFREQSFISEYRWYILGLVVFIASQMLIIIYLIRASKTQKMVKHQILENQVMFNKIVREDRLSKMTVLTASLSHELNQPLTAILSCAQAGMRFLDSDELDREQAREIFRNIIEDDKRAGGIISGVRALMKLEIREKEKVMVNSMLNETLDIMRTEISRHGIRITTDFEDSPVFISADKIQIQQVLLNFLRNSIDAMEENDPENKKIEVSTRLITDTVIVSVLDSGPGIDKSILDSIFKPFVTAGKPGFGIGLAVSRSIIENHQGSIWAENKRGGGAEFSFRLKVIKNE